MKLTIDFPKPFTPEDDPKLRAAEDHCAAADVTLDRTRRALVDAEAHERRVAAAVHAGHATPAELERAGAQTRAAGLAVPVAGQALAQARSALEAESRAAARRFQDRVAAHAAALQAVADKLAPVLAEICEKERALSAAHALAMRDWPVSHRAGLPAVPAVTWPKSLADQAVLARTIVTLSAARSA